MISIRKVAFYGSSYDYSLVVEGLSHLQHVVELERIENEPLLCDADILFLGHHLPLFDANRILAEGTPHARYVVVVSHGPFPLNGTPAPTSLGAMAYHFRWQSEPTLASAIVELVRDQCNAEEFYHVQHRRFLLLIEDEVNFASYFIPLILRELTERTLSLLPPQSTESRQKAETERPVLLLASDFETAVEFMTRYGDRTVGVISALGFPRNGRNDRDAGIRLLEKRNELNAEFPVVIISARQEREPEILSLGAAFLPKTSPHLLSSLRQQLLDSFGFGDFIFRMPAAQHGAGEVARARSLSELRQCLEWVPIESFLYHASKRHFSNWLGVHGHLQLAEVVREIPPEEGELARKKLLDLL